jgi:hypothetical protein
MRGDKEPGVSSAVAMKWEAQTLRFTFFPSQVTQVSSEWWQAITQQAPEAENALPRQHVITISGSYRGVYLTLSSSPDRVDLLIQPLPPQQGQLGEPVAGDANELIELLCEGALAISDRIPVASRLAFGGILFQPTSSSEASYALLKDVLKSVSVTPGKMSDLNYRVNWPVEIEGRKYNRLGTWSSVLVKAFLLQPIGPSNLSINERHFLSFEFDINTAPLAELEIRADETPLELERMVALVKENMEQGEVPSV